MEGNGHKVQERGQSLQSTVSLKMLLEAGVHFGHQTARWHPRMKKYIFAERNGIHIIDLEQTAAKLAVACNFIRGVIAEGGKLLFVGTKRQAQEIIAQEATRCSMYYVNQRWLGGMLTNFITVQSRIDYLVSQEERKSKGVFVNLPKKEAMKLDKEIARMNQLMGGFKDMTSLPDALFVVDPTKDGIALAEARRMGIPIVGMVDTNVNPNGIDYPIPSNDDAIRAIKLICSKIADAVLEGIATRQVVEAEETKEATQVEPGAEVEGEKLAAAPELYSFAPDDGEDE